MDKIKNFGLHLLIDGNDCNAKRLADKELIENVLVELPKLIDMNPITEPTIREWLDKWAETPGYTGFVVLAESHFSLHTFPDSGYIFIDLFSSRNFDAEPIINYLVKKFDIKDAKTHLIVRGEKFTSKIEKEA